MISGPRLKSVWFQHFSSINNCITSQTNNCKNYLENTACNLDGKPTSQSIRFHFEAAQITLSWYGSSSLLWFILFPIVIHSSGCAQLARHSRKENRTDVKRPFHHPSPAAPHPTVSWMQVLETGWARYPIPSPQATTAKQTLGICTFFCFKWVALWPSRIYYIVLFLLCF